MGTLLLYYRYHDYEPSVGLVDSSPILYSTTSQVLCIIKPSGSTSLMLEKPALGYHEALNPSATSLDEESEWLLSAYL